jgi:hypothetical protein
MEAIIMALKEQIEHAAAVTKWKADQQMRILKIQGQINDMENTIKGRVYALGESALRLSEQGELQQPNLQGMTHEIANLKEQLLGLQQTLTAVKTESGPQRPETQQSFSGLVCPVCGVMLRGNFCPEHGVAGVLPSAPEPTVPLPSEGYLACPICNQPLNGKFCPVHGVDGVWVEHNPPADTAPELWSPPIQEAPPAHTDSEPWSNASQETASGYESSESQPTSWSTYNPIPPENPQPDQSDRLDHDNL